MKKKTYNFTNSERDVTSESEVPTKPMPANFLYGDGKTKLSKEMCRINN